MGMTITGGDNAAKRDIRKGIASLNRVQQDIFADLITRHEDFFKAFLTDYNYLNGNDLHKVLDLTAQLKAKHFSR